MNGGPRVRVRESGPAREVGLWEFDEVPCRMRMSMPGTRRLIHPVPGRPDGVSRNTDCLVWCECMAQTPAQLDHARDVRAGLVDADAPWPEPRLQRGWDVLGAVQTIIEGTTVAASSRARRSNPLAPRQARRMWEDHVVERRRRIEER